jgi:hypothetical protein
MAPNPLFAAGTKFVVGPQIEFEIPSLHASATGTISGTGSVTNDTVRIIPGIYGSWTSPPVTSLPLSPAFGAGLFIGAPASGDSVASALTTGGFTLKLQQNSSWPILMPSIYAGTRVTDTTRVNVATGLWLSNIKETVTLSNGSFTESDVHSMPVVRPFIGAAIIQRFPTMPFLPGDFQEVKISGGYIFANDTFQANFCPGGQSCVRATDRGSWYFGLALHLSFAGGAH